MWLIWNHSPSVSHRYFFHNKHISKTINVLSALSKNIEPWCLTFMDTFLSWCILVLSSLVLKLSLVIICYKWLTFYYICNFKISTLYRCKTEENYIQPFIKHLVTCAILLFKGAGRSSEVERSLMVRWVVGSIFHGVDPLSYFSFQPVLHDWCNKGRGMCYPVCGMVHIKEPLLLIDKSSLCGGSGFPFSLWEWSLTICLTPYNRR